MVLYRALLRNRAALDTSETGTGKTIVAAHIARHLHDNNCPVGVVCPKSVVTSWERALRAHGVDPEFVLNYHKLIRGVDGIVRVRAQRKNKNGRTYKWYTWEVPKDTLLIFDEVQQCRGEATQFGNLLIAAKKQNLRTLSLSATAAKDPTEMRALGYALGLHNLNDERGNNSYPHWRKKVGCKCDPWGTWYFPSSGDLTPLNDLLYRGRKIASGLRTSDLPEAFRDNRIIVERGDYDKVGKVYAEAGITEDVVGAMMDLEGAAADAQGLPVVEVLRARQLAEMAKVPHFVEEAQAALDEGRSVIAVFNFRESVELFAKAFPESRTMLGQQAGRQEILDDWAEDKFRVLAVSASAGGTGVNLHDQRGEFPRTVLINPDWSPHTLKQVLGRAYRNGMKTDVVQKILIAADTVEEYVYEKCGQGIRTMDQMLGS